MIIGFGLVLVVIGAILVFAVDAQVQGLDLTTVGWIVLGAGVVVFLIGLVMAIPRSRRARSTAITTDRAGRQWVTEREDRIDGV